MSDTTSGDLVLRAQSIVNIERQRDLEHGDVVYRLQEIMPFEWVIRRMVYRGVEKPSDLQLIFTRFEEAKEMLLSKYEEFLDEAIKLGSILEGITEQSQLEYGSGIPVVADEAGPVGLNYRTKRLNEIKKQLKR